MGSICSERSLWIKSRVLVVCDLEGLELGEQGEKVEVGEEAVAKTEVLEPDAFLQKGARVRSECP